MNTPGEEQIRRVMESTGMDYIQARNHLISRRRALQEIERQRRSIVAKIVDQEKE